MLTKFFLLLLLVCRNGARCHGFVDIIRDAGIYGPISFPIVTGARGVWQTERIVRRIQWRIVRFYWIPTFRVRLEKGKLPVKGSIDTWNRTRKYRNDGRHWRSGWFTTNFRAPCKGFQRGMLSLLRLMHLIRNMFFSVFQATQFIDLLQSVCRQFALNITTNGQLTQNLPPTSAQSFLRENISFPAVVLNSKPQNRFYHSIYDDQDNIKFRYYNTSEDFTVAMARNDNAGYPADSVQLAIRDVSTVLAATIYQLITGKPYNGDQGANPVLVSGDYPLQSMRRYNFFFCLFLFRFADWRIFVLLSGVVRMSIIQSCRSKESATKIYGPATVKVTTIFLLTWFSGIDPCTGKKYSWSRGGMRTVCSWFCTFDFRMF